jgi:hypothetical protein
MDKQQPAHKIRLGVVKATIWENGTRNGTLFNVTIHLYKEGDNWKQATNFSRNDSCWQTSDSPCLNRNTHRSFFLSLLATGHR